MTAASVPFWLLAAAGVLSGTIAACGGGGGGSGSTPTAPTPPVTSTPPPVPSGPLPQWAVQGRVVSYGSGQPIANARVTPEVGDVVMSDAGGNFSIGSRENPPFTPYKVTVEAPGHVTREARLNWQRGQRENVVIDLIGEGPPFSIDFFRQLVRNAIETPEALEPLRRLSEPPRFYIKTTDDRGASLDPDAIAVLAQMIPTSVRDWTGGRLSVAAIEMGPEARPETTGWINVVIEQELENACGRARVAGNPGLIRFDYDRCTCNSRERLNPEVIRHEVGHAMGFWHVNDPHAAMHPGVTDACRPNAISEIERYHAALAYQRPHGSLDPDTDPRGVGFALGEQSAPPIEVICYR